MSRRVFARSVSAADLDVTRRGSGPRVVLVHGSVVGAQRTWSRQLALADRWTLVLPNRPGFACSPPLQRGDFQAEAPLIAELLGDGAHLVGHSYGAVIALYAAALRPGAGEPPGRRALPGQLAFQAKNPGFLTPAAVIRPPALAGGSSYRWIQPSA